jgi:hypothetical protein
MVGPLDVVIADIQTSSPVEKDLNVGYSAILPDSSLSCIYRIPMCSLFSNRFRLLFEDPDVANLYSLKHLYAASSVLAVILAGFTLVQYTGGLKGDERRRSTFFLKQLFKKFRQELNAGCSFTGGDLR